LSKNERISSEISK